MEIKAFKRSDGSVELVLGDHHALVENALNIPYAVEFLIDQATKNAPFRLAKAAFEAFAGEPACM